MRRCLHRNRPTTLKPCFQAVGLYPARRSRSSGSRVPEQVFASGPWSTPPCIRLSNGDGLMSSHRRESDLDEVDRFECADQSEAVQGSSQRQLANCMVSSLSWPGVARSGRKLPPNVGRLAVIVRFNESGPLTLGIAVARVNASWAVPHTTFTPRHAGTYYSATSRGIDSSRVRSQLPRLRLPCFISE